jgi:signal transduction histidine kinase
MDRSHTGSDLTRPLLASFADPAATDFSAVLNAALDRLGERLGRGFRVGGLLLNEGFDDCWWHAEIGPVVGEPHTFACCDYPAADSPCQYLLAELRAGRTSLLSPLQAADPSWQAEWHWLTARGVASALHLPLQFAGKLFGVLYVEALSPDAQWPTALVDELQAVARLLALYVDRHQQHKDVAIRAAADHVLSQVSSQLANARPEELDAQIDAALKKLGQTIEADRTFYFELSPDGRSASCVAEWSAPGVPSLKSHLQQIPAETFAPILSRAERNQPIYLSHLRQASELQGKLQELVQVMSVQSALHVPLFVSGKLVGSVGMSAVSERASWSESRIALLRLVGEMILSAVERRRNVQVLEVHREQLTTASRMAVMGEMVAGIAHEIRQPLQAMRSFAAAGIHSIGDDRSPTMLEIRAWNERIMDLVDRTNEIIRRYRDFCRPQRASVELLDLHLPINEALQLLQADFRGNGVFVQLESSPRLPKVQGDRILLEQVFVNLLRNASESLSGTARADRRIEVRLAAACDNKVSHPVVRASIRDYGLGLGSNDPERSFDPFWTTKPTGTGLGLPVCRTIITEHGGRIWLEAASPGAMAIVELPAKVEASE